MINSLTNTLEANAGVALAIIGGVCALLLLLLLFTWGGMRSLRRRYAFLLRNEQTRDLGEIFAEHDARMKVLESGYSSQSDKLQQLDAALKLCVQRVGFVRFDAFDDVGGQQSYALAMLDSGGNGVIVSGLYSRSDMRTYAKAIRGGRCEQNLTDEEQRALDMAAQSAEIRSSRH